MFFFTFRDMENYMRDKYERKLFMGDVISTGIGRMSLNDKSKNNFMDSEIYMRINYNSIDSIRFQHFYKYYKTLEKLISAISGHKF